MLHYSAYDTQELKEVLTGKNKAFITKVANQQEAKYGNVDVFSATYEKSNPRYVVVEVCFGENWIDFYFDNNGKIFDTLGIGQGHKYHKSLESVAQEIYKLNQEQDLDRDIEF